MEQFCGSERERRALCYHYFIRDPSTYVFGIFNPVQYFISIWQRLMSLGYTYWLPEWVDRIAEESDSMILLA